MMMGIFSRLFKVGEAKANKVLDKLEKPELMLEQAIRDQEKSIREAKQKVQQVIATERQNKALLDQANREKEQWNERAQLALTSGKEDLATKALTRGEEEETKVNQLMPVWQEQRNSVDGLKMDIQKMEDELAELKRNKDMIIAQSKAAEVKKSIYEAKAKIGKKNSTTDLIARMKDKAERSQFEAEAAKEMAENSPSSGDRLADEFKTLEGTQASTSVQAKLEAMKAKLKDKN